MPHTINPSRDADCRACGACCSVADDWPRFTLENEAALARIPEAYVAADLSGMRCDQGRCSALVGKVGIRTGCGVYEVRPDVCRACVPGGEDCRMARELFNLPALAAI